MNYSLKLTVTSKDPSEFLKIIQSEEGSKDRSEIKITSSKKNVDFNVTARDTTALKASINRILKALTIYEKTTELVKND